MGGGIASEGEIFFAPLRKYFLQMTIGPSAKEVTIVPAELGEEAGVRGILALLNDSFLKRKKSENAATFLN